MVDTITRNSSPTVPIADLIGVVHPYDSGYAVENIAHGKLNSSGFNVTYRPTRLRSGRLTLLFETPTQAHTAIGLLGSAYTFTLSAEVAAATMTFFVTRGELKPEHNDEADVWTVTVPFQEVT
jgi:hypothetical protein